MSNQASVTSSVPSAPESAPTHGDRRYAANAVARKRTASPVSNPDQARSHRWVTWRGDSEVDSQIVHGSRPRPVAVKARTTHSRNVEGRKRTAAYTVANDDHPIRRGS